MRLWILIAAVLLLLPASHAALVDWNIDIALNEDRTSDWVVTLSYNESVEKNDYFFLGTISSYNVTADGSPADCSFSQGVGSSIVCDSLNAKSIVYTFRTIQTVQVLQHLRLFKYRFSVFQNTDRFAVTVKLPVGSPLADPNQLSNTELEPFEPAFGRQGSDGRRIFVSWVLDRPVLGTAMDASVVYEQLEQSQVGLFIGIVIALIAAFLAVLFFMFKRNPVKDILPVLTDSERKVVKIVLREKGSVDQRQIVKETDFSKAKVSRVISDLVNRGILEKETRGRKNLIRLKRSIKPEKIGKIAKSETTKIEGE